MGVARDANQEDDQACVPETRAQVPPGRQQGKGRRGEIQGTAGSARGPEGRGEARGLRPARRRLAAGPGFPAAAGLGQGLRVLARRRAAGARGGAGGRMGDFSDFFSELFGERSPFGQASGGGRSGRAGRGFAAAGQDHVARVEIDLEDAYRGGSRDIELRSPEVTPEGHVVVKPRTLRVTIPAGVTEGQQIRLAGQGSPGTGGGPPGNLLLEIGFRAHPRFRVEGRDITATLPVAPWEAALGETRVGTHSRWIGGHEAPGRRDAQARGCACVVAACRDPRRVTSTWSSRSSCRPTAHGPGSSSSR